MAELIPVEYRARAAQRKVLFRWALLGTMALALAAAGLTYTFAWQSAQAKKLADLQAEFRQRSQLIARSQELRARRASLAARLQRMHQLTDDRALVNLLHHVADGFTETDCLEQVTADIRGGDGQTGDGDYAVKLVGVTDKLSSLAALMTRLNRPNQPAVTAGLEALRRERYMDGEVLRFQIVCKNPKTQG